MLVGSNEPVALHVDASITGLDVALFQNNKPIAFASKALTPAETRYATIERELLAVVYDCEKVPLVPLRKIVCGQNRPSPPRTDPQKEPDASTSKSSKNDVVSTTLRLRC